MLGSPRSPPSAPDAAPADAGGRSFSAFFRPIVGTRDEYARFFQDGGFGDWTDLVVHQTYGFVRFSSLARVDLFIEAFRCRLFNGAPISAARSRAPPAAGRTLHLSLIDPRCTTERSIYSRFSPYGFIRRVALKGAYAFVEFDSAEDADRALTQFCGRNGAMLDGVRIGITYARTEHRADHRALEIRLADVLPETHEFWRQLELSLDR